MSDLITASDFLSFFKATGPDDWPVAPTGWNAAFVLLGMNDSDRRMSKAAQRLASIAWAVGVGVTSTCERIKHYNRPTPRERMIAMLTDAVAKGL